MADIEDLVLRLRENSVEPLDDFRAPLTRDHWSRILIFAFKHLDDENLTSLLTVAGEADIRWSNQIAGAVRSGRGALLRVVKEPILAWKTDAEWPALIAAIVGDDDEFDALLANLRLGKKRRAEFLRILSRLKSSRYLSSAVAHFEGTTTADCSECLISACAFGSVECAKLMLRLGATASRRKFAAVEYSIYHGFEDCFLLVWSDKCRYQPGWLDYAVKSRSELILSRLASLKNIPRDDIDEALATARDRDHFGAIRLLEELLESRSAEQ